MKRVNTGQCLSKETKVQLEDCQKEGHWWLVCYFLMVSRYDILIAKFFGQDFQWENVVLFKIIKTHLQVVCDNWKSCCLHSFRDHVALQLKCNNLLVNTTSPADLKKYFLGMWDINSAANLWAFCECIMWKDAKPEAQRFLISIISLFSVSQILISV